MSTAHPIMLVDDHPMMRRGMRQLLEMEDDLKVIAEANHGQEALEMLKEHHPELILLDNNMPQMNGLETLKKLRQSGFTGRVLLFTVSDAEEDVRAHGTEAGRIVLEDSVWLGSAAVSEVYVVGVVAQYWNTGNFRLGFFFNSVLR